MSQWNPTAVKVYLNLLYKPSLDLIGSLQAHLRLTSQRLGQLQEKKDSSGVVTRRDIATLLQNGNTSLARAKAQKLLREDAIGDVLEMLEMHVGLVLEHIQEFENTCVVFSALGNFC
jgi:hypothetical protein